MQGSTSTGTADDLSWKGGERTSRRSVTREALWPVTILIALALLAPRAAAEGVVIFKTKDIGPYNEAIEGFKAACGAPVTEVDMGGDDQVGLARVEEIRQAAPQVIFAVGTKAAKIAKERLAEFPVIFCMVLNPDKNGVLGPNTTGVLLQIPYSKQFELIKTVLPGLKVVGVLYDPAKTEDNITLATQEAQVLGVKLVPVQVSSEKDVPNGLRNLLGQGVDLVWLTTDSTVLNKETFQYIVTSTLEKNIPLMAYQSSYVKAGAFVALAPSYKGIGEQAGKMAKKIIAGTKVTELQIEPPDVNRLALNLKVASQIGIKVPQGVIQTADELVQP